MNEHAKRLLVELALEVVEELAQEVDPDAQHYPNALSLHPLRRELELVLEGRIADWNLEQRQEHGEP